MWTSIYRGFFLVIVLFFYTHGAGNLKRKWQVREKQQKYTRYHECLKRLGEEIQGINGHTQPFQLKTFLHSSTVNLRCFPWWVTMLSMLKTKRFSLSPEDEESTEEVWKPKDSYVCIFKLPRLPFISDFEKNSKDRKPNQTGNFSSAWSNLTIRILVAT